MKKTGIDRCGFEARGSAMRVPRPAALKFPGQLADEYTNRRLCGAKE
jgi:hypothetical protein